MSKSEWPHSDRCAVRIGIVVIGRNEGARLTRCLDSLLDHREQCVYVDSGSTDDSVNQARLRGMAVVELDMSVPFTAARARNSGFAYLTKLAPQIDYVHFIDGDCEVLPGWFARAQEFLDERPDVGVVFGVTKERHPERSVYNSLLAVEWGGPIGSVKASAGLLMCRRRLFEELHGFREDLIAAEDTEFCLRLRALGAKVWRLGEPMALHDGEMYRFSQWWRRAKRAGFAYAEGVRLHGASPERHFVKELRSVFVWAGIIPLLVVVATIFVSPWALLGLLVYPLQVLRVTFKGKGNFRSNATFAAFVMLAKFSELTGALKYYLDRIGEKPKHLIEYK
jgi:GT2 family glycosyltransferase